MENSLLSGLDFYFEEVIENNESSETFKNTEVF